MDAGVAEHPGAITFPPEPQPTPPGETLTPHDIASALADALSLESLVTQLGEAPAGLVQGLFNMWLERAAPIPYHPRVIEFVYEELAPMDVENIVQTLGEEELELMLYAALETPSSEEEARDLEEYMDHQLAKLLQRQGPGALEGYRDVKRAFAEQGRPGWQAAKSVWAHLLNSALNASGL